KRLFEVSRHEKLHAVAVKADQLAQKADRQQVLPLLLLLDDDLGQHRAGEVLAGLGVVDDEIATLLDQRGKIVERHIAAGRSIVEPPVGVFLDDHWFGAAWLAAAGTAHAPGVPRKGRCCSATIQRFAVPASSKTPAMPSLGCRQRPPVLYSPR